MNTYQEVESAKNLLEENGYQVYNLWCIDDVKHKWKCTDKEAMNVLIGALQNDATMEQIWFAIDVHAESDGLIEKTEEEMNNQYK